MFKSCWLMEAAAHCKKARSSSQEPSLILQMTPNWYWLPMTILLPQLLQMLPLMTHQPLVNLNPLMRVLPLLLISLHCKNQFCKG